MPKFDLEHQFIKGKLIRVLWGSQVPHRLSMNMLNVPITMLWFGWNGIVVNLCLSYTS